MSLEYRAVAWNRQKKIYDRTLLLGVAGYLSVFLVCGLLFRPNATLETLLIRSFGSAAIILLHIILAIGPLCRLDPRFLPFLYNRRHMGVVMFLLALVHGGFSIIQFHSLGNLNPIESLISGGSYSSLADFPFQLLGFVALFILFLMAATSHDFWLVNLSAPVWKALHMCVYLAYVLVILHVVLGVLQVESHPLFASLLGLSMLSLLGLHLCAGFRDRLPALASATDDFVDVCAVSEIPLNYARIFSLAGERVAVFRHDQGISAISNVCQHQNGPLGEGKIIDGCVTCPWHGNQYRPCDGTSPEPFTEKVPTFQVRVRKGRVLVHPTPNMPGTHVDPAALDG